MVEQVWVYGNSYENFLVGVAVPDKGELTKWASSNGASSNLEELCKNPKVLIPWTATCCCTGAVADVATSHDPQRFFLTLKANLRPRLEIGVADVPA